MVRLALSEITFDRTMKPIKERFLKQWQKFKQSLKLEGVAKTGSGKNICFSLGGSINKLNYKLNLGLMILGHYCLTNKRVAKAYVSFAVLKEYNERMHTQNVYINWVKRFNEHTLKLFKLPKFDNAHGNNWQ